MAITKIGTPELFDFSSLNTALKLPTGTTAERPGTLAGTSAPVAGEWRYNTTLKYVEYYDGTSWFRIDTEALPSPAPGGSENFNTNTYFGNGATQEVDAKFNEAANFSGSSSFITLPNSSSISQQNNFTISFWVKPNGFVAYGTVVTFYSNYRNYVDIRTGGVLGFQTTSGNQLDTPSGSITDGVWQHIAVTKSSTAGTVIYVDGVSVATDSSDTGNASDFTSASYPNTLGAFKTTGSVDYFFPGSIDQVRIYNSALDQAAVTALQLETTTTASSLYFPSGETATATYQLDGNGDDISGTYSATSTTDIGYTGLKFTPDWVWIKQRNTSGSYHQIYDIVRGVEKVIFSNDSLPQYDRTNGLTSFDSNGFTLGNHPHSNAASPNDYVAWNWYAPTAQSISATGTGAGARLASTIKKNVDAGFSIVSYTGGNTTNNIVGHGLDSAPELILFKSLSQTAKWEVYANPIGANNYLTLDDTNAKVPDIIRFRDTNPTDEVFTVGIALNGNSIPYIAYCFHSVVGYSKIGSYTWTNTSYTAGTMVTTLGFTPRFVMIKRTNGVGNWQMYDSSRGATSGTQQRYALYADNSDIQNTTDYQSIGFDSDGFSAIVGANGNTTGSGGLNENNGEYLYLAIA